MSRKTISITHLRRHGIEALPRDPGKRLHLPHESRLEAPCSLKWTSYEHSLTLGAFSYQVSGYAFAARVGRYCSFGENVQIGRQDHPLTWASTSPAFYLGAGMFDLDGGYDGADAFASQRPAASQPPTRVKITKIGHDVWIGHGAFVRAGVEIGTGAVVAAHSVVVKDVPPFAVVAGNPARIRRYRLPPELISPMLRSQWWRFAPWQLAHLDPAQPEPFVKGVFAMQKSGETAYEPPVFTPAQTD